MKESWAKLKEWWLNLPLREKQGVMVGGSLLGIFIIYQFIWTPSLDRVIELRSRIARDQKMLVWMEAVDKEIQKNASESHNTVSSASPVTLLGTLQKQISNAGLDQSLTQLKQASNETVAMHFQKVDFDKLVQLLTTVLKESNVSISQMSAISDNSPGTVNADVMLKLNLPNLSSRG